MGFSGTAEAVPFPKPFPRTVFGFVSKFEEQKSGGVRTTE